MDNEKQAASASGKLTAQPITAGLNTVDFRIEFASPTDACRVSGLGRTYLYNLMKTGCIRSVLLRKRGAAVGKRLVDMDSLRAFLRGEAEKQAAYQAGPMQRSENGGDGLMETSQTLSGNEFGDLKRVKRLKSISADAPSKVGLFRRVYSGKASPREAIKGQCLECCWMDEAAIRECKATACPLWNFRPYQKAKEKRNS